MRLRMNVLRAANLAPYLGGVKEKMWLGEQLGMRVARIGDVIPKWELECSTSSLEDASTLTTLGIHFAE
jgi:hypothetical protein